VRQIAPRSGAVAGQIAAIARPGRIAGRYTRKGAIYDRGQPRLLVELGFPTCRKLNRQDRAKCASMLAESSLQRVERVASRLVTRAEHVAPAVQGLVREGRQGPRYGSDYCSEAGLPTFARDSIETRSVTGIFTEPSPCPDSRGSGKEGAPDKEKAGGDDWSATASGLSTRLSQNQGGQWTKGHRFFQGFSV
jgi:hypothetical protein